MSDYSISTKWTKPLPDVSRIGGQLSAVVSKAAHDIEGDIRQRIVSVGAVDTSNYINHWATHKTGEFEAEVSNPVEYGTYIEWGTTRMPARPHFIPAVEAAWGPFERAIKALWDRI